MLARLFIGTLLVGTSSPVTPAQIVINIPPDVLPDEAFFAANSDVIVNVFGGVTLAIPDHGSGFDFNGATLNVSGAATVTGEPQGDGLGFELINATVNVTDGAVLTPLGLAVIGIQSSSLTIGDGGEVRSIFYAANGSSVIVDGGRLGVLGGNTPDSYVQLHNSELLLRSGVVHLGSGSTYDANSRVTVEGGLLDGIAVGEGSLAISGGRIDGSLLFADIHITGGTFSDNTFIAGAGEVSGGVFEGSLGYDFGVRAQEGLLHVRGGSFGDVAPTHLSAVNAGYLRISGGTGISIVSCEEGSTVEIIGAEFFLDGAWIEVGLHTSALVLAREGVLSGLLSDGSSFGFGLGFDSNALFPGIDPNATVILTRVPAPSSGLLLAMGLCAARRRR